MCDSFGCTATRRLGGQRRAGSGGGRRSAANPDRLQTVLIGFLTWRAEHPLVAGNGFPRQSPQGDFAGSAVAPKVSWLALPGTHSQWQPITVAQGLRVSGATTTLLRSCRGSSLVRPSRTWLSKPVRPLRAKCHTARASGQQAGAGIHRLLAVAEGLAAVPETLSFPMQPGRYTLTW